MLEFLIGLLASVSSVFISGANKPNAAAPLNTAIIAYQETYYVPAVADLGNFPWAKKISSEVQTLITKTTPAEPIPLPAPLSPPSSPPPPPTPVLPPAPVPVGDSYLANPEPFVDWYVPTTFRRDSTDNSALPEMTFNREFWRMEVLAYWAPGALSKTSVEKDYFKLEVYEKGTDKLIFTMTSGTEETIHKSQAFKKPGTYYFNTYLKNPSQFEITFTFH